MALFIPHPLHINIWWMWIISSISLSFYCSFSVSVVWWRPTKVWKVLTGPTPYVHDMVLLIKDFWIIQCGFNVGLLNHTTIYMSRLRFWLCLQFVHFNFICDLLFYSLLWWLALGFSHLSNGHLGLFLIILLISFTK